MPFIPHTDADIAEMLATIGIDRIETLFDEIPVSLRNVSLSSLPPGVSEMTLRREMAKRAKQDEGLLCFMGAGAYEHHIPATVWDIATRGEFMTAYTPYQAEASQGSLQLIYEFQTMMASLMALEIANASLYDGASALAEAILMAVRLSPKNKTKILLPETIHPAYRQTVQTIVSQQGIELIDVPYHRATGIIDPAALVEIDCSEVAAIVIPQPNFFGQLEDVDALTHFAQTAHILSIAVVNPTAMALLKPPGQWGETGVDIACGEGQPLGIPLASGGPYFGFLCCKKNHVRQMPGRIVGRTVDMSGKMGFVLTLQAREQHIRRAKATSNICTNQGLMVTAATIYLSLLGPLGLRRVALASHLRTQQLAAALRSLPHVSLKFSGSYFHEVVVEIDGDVDELIASLAAEGIQAGYPLGHFYPELNHCLLLCATETKTKEDIEILRDAFKRALQGAKVACLG